MGYRGKIEERARARELRAQAWTLQEIADELGVAKSSVSTWVRDVDFVAKPRKSVAAQRSFVHPLRQRKLDEIARLDAAGRQRLAVVSEEAFLLAGVALYAGEGTKADGAVAFANIDPDLIALFCRWLRHFFEVDETRLRARIYLHRELDHGAAVTHWSRHTDIPPEQFRQPYRPEGGARVRRNRHEYGCCYVRYACSRTHREIMGLVRALATIGMD
jgi:transcriptional regulator with XRE-family HTH domain